MPSTYNTQPSTHVSYCHHFYFLGFDFLHVVGMLAVSYCTEFLYVLFNFCLRVQTAQSYFHEALSVRWFYRCDSPDLHLPDPKTGLTLGAQGS